MGGREVVIVSAARTPIGSFGGELASLSASDLGATAIKAALARAGVEGRDVGDVTMGCVLQAGQGQAPARQAAIRAGLPTSVPCQTINKVCGSGLKAVITAAQGIALGDTEVAVAGGMESMSNVPYYLLSARNGFRMGHQQATDGMIFDGLWDPYNNFHMGSAAELCARERKIDRAAQDAFAADKGTHRWVSAAAVLESGRVGIPAALRSVSEAGEGMPDATVAGTAGGFGGRTKPPRLPQPASKLRASVAGTRNEHIMRHSKSRQC